MDFILAAGQIHDVNAVGDLLANIDAHAFIADKAYDADAVIDTLKARNIQPVIPPKRNRKVQRDYDKQMYKERNLVERFFNKLKQFRGIATRYEKLAINFMAGVYLAASTILLK
jgi:putative transposase